MTDFKPAQTSAENASPVSNLIDLFDNWEADDTGLWSSFVFFVTEADFYSSSSPWDGPFRTSDSNV